MNYVRYRLTLCLSLGPHIAGDHVTPRGRGREEGVTMWSGGSKGCWGP